MLEVAVKFLEFAGWEGGLAPAQDSMRLDFNYVERGQAHLPNLQICGAWVVDSLFIVFIHSIFAACSGCVRLILSRNHGITRFVE